MQQGAERTESEHCLNDVLGRGNKIQHRVRAIERGGPESCSSTAATALSIFLFRSSIGEPRACSLDGEALVANADARLVAA